MLEILASKNFLNTYDLSTQHIRAVHIVYKYSD
jgi:hypothetical protein